MNVKLSWTKSVSADVVSQALAYTVNGSDGAAEDLAADVESYVFANLNESDVLEVAIRAFNGKKFSVPAVGSFTLPETPAPEAPTNLVFEVLPE